jgi:hypothetical protein
MVPSGHALIFFPPPAVSFRYTPCPPVLKTAIGNGVGVGFGVAVASGVAVGTGVGEGRGVSVGAGTTGGAGGGATLAATALPLVGLGAAMVADSTAPEADHRIMATANGPARIQGKRR